VGETLEKDWFTMSEPFFGTSQLPFNVLHVKTTNILEFDSLEQIPDALLRIEFWRVARQAFEMDTFGSAFGQKVFDRLRAMNGRSVPDHQQEACDLTQEQLQKANHIRPFVRMVLRLHHELSVRGDGTYRPRDDHGSRGRAM
jgi:hypothetical protein